MDINGIVINPSRQRNSVNSQPRLGMGQQSELLVRELGGKWAAAAQDGNVFLSTTLVGGVTVPAPATTLASKAGWRNPLGSPVNMELIAIGISSITIEVALKNFALEFQVNASGTGGIPTAITDLTAYPMPLGVGKGTSFGKAYTAATMTNAAANNIIMPIFGDNETAVGFTPTLFPFEVPLWMGPDTICAVTVVTALAAVQFVYIWAEWPI